MTKENDSILLSAFDERWKKFRAQHKACRMEFTDEAVHDLRVASRRMLVVLGLAKTIAPHPRVRKARQIIKRMIEDLNELRDVQVMLVETSENIETMPELKPFRKFLKKREAKLMRAAYKRIKQNGLSELSKRIGKIRESLEKEEQANAQFNEQLLEAAHNAYALAGQAYGQVDPLQAASIHRLRLAFKKFRYLIEIIHPLVEGFPSGNFESMHKYQGSMGNIQDAEVFLNSFLEYVKEHSPRTDTESVIRFFNARLKSLVVDFMENKGEIFTFWNFDKPKNEEHKNESLRHTSRNRSGGGESKIRRGRSAPADRKGEGQDEENRPGVMGDGNTNGPDLEQPGSAGHGDGKDTGEQA